MDVKGTAVVTIEQFVRDKAGAEGVDRWFDSLPPASRQILRERILATAWYPVVEALILPTQAVCDLLYDGDPKGAWELGRASAEYGLRGPYKIWSKVAPPATLMARAVSIIQGYYRPVGLKLENATDHGCDMHLTGIDPPTPLIAGRIGGWTERALKIGGAQDSSVFIQQTATRPTETTIIQSRW